MVKNDCFAFLSLTSNSFSIMIDDWNCWSSLTFNSLTDLQNCLEFPAGTVCTCDALHFGVRITLLHSCLCLALRLGLFLNLRYLGIWNCILEWHDKFQYSPKPTSSGQNSLRNALFCDCHKCGFPKHQYSCWALHALWTFAKGYLIQFTNEYKTGWERKESMADFQ